jgi:hypothetical protein
MIMNIGRKKNSKVQRIFNNEEYWFLIIDVELRFFKDVKQAGAINCIFIGFDYNI